MKRSLTAVLFFAGLVFLWHMLVVWKVWSSVLLPDPLDVWKYLVSSVEDRTMFEALLVTLKRLLFGYIIGVIAGIPLGLLTARFQSAHDTIGVLALGLQTLPSVCWVPLALLWFGLRPLLL